MVTVVVVVLMVVAKVVVFNGCSRGVTGTGNGNGDASTSPDILKSSTGNGLPPPRPRSQPLLLLIPSIPTYPAGNDQGNGNGYEGRWSSCGGDIGLRQAKGISNYCGYF